MFYYNWLTIDGRNMMKLPRSILRDFGGSCGNPVLWVIEWTLTPRFSWWIMLPLELWPMTSSGLKMKNWLWFLSFCHVSVLCCYATVNKHAIEFETSWKSICSLKAVRWNVWGIHLCNNASIWMYCDFLSAKNVILQCIF